MNKSILGMNWTTGQRDLQSGDALTPLERIQVKLDLASQLDNDKQGDFNREVGRGMRRDAFLELVDFANTDVAHVNSADPRTPEQRVHKTWESAMQQRDRDFNRRYYNNPDGKPEFVYK